MSSGNIKHEENFIALWPKIASMIRKYHNHKPQKNPWYREEEPSDTNRAVNAMNDCQVLILTIVKCKYGKLFTGKPFCLGAWSIVE